MSASHRFVLLMLIAQWSLSAAPARSAAPPGPPSTKQVPAREAPAASSLTDETVPSMRRLPLTAEEKAVFQIREETRTQVDELVRRMVGLTDGPASRALQGKIEELKQRCRIQVLRTKVDFARQRGDLRAVREVEDLIDQMLHPRSAPAASVVRQPPEGSADREVSRP